MKRIAPAPPLQNVVVRFISGNNANVKVISDYNHCGSPKKRAAAPRRCLTETAAKLARYCERKTKQHRARKSVHPTNLAPQCAHGAKEYRHTRAHCRPKAPKRP